MYINERVFVIIGSFLKPLGVLESLVRLLRKLACGDYKMNHKSSVKTGLWLVYQTNQSFSWDVCHDFRYRLVKDSHELSLCSLFPFRLTQLLRAASSCFVVQIVLTSEQTVSQQNKHDTWHQHHLTSGRGDIFVWWWLSQSVWLRTKVLQDFCASLCSPHTQVCEVTYWTFQNTNGFKNEQIMTKIRSFMYVVKIGFLRFENAKIRWFSYEVSRTRS